MKKLLRHRPRSVPVDTSLDHLDQGDMDALGILLNLTGQIMDSARSHLPEETLSEIFSEEELQGLVLLNHAMSYIEDPKKYADEIRPQLYGYLVIK